jgi:hypothetical protein
MKAYEKGYESVPGSTLPEDQKQVWLGRLSHGKARTLAKMGRHEQAWAEAEKVKTMIESGGEPGKQYWPGLPLPRRLPAAREGRRGEGARAPEAGQRRQRSVPRAAARAGVREGRRQAEREEDLRDGARVQEQRPRARARVPGGEEAIAGAIVAPP